jgi:N-ethylmaleimide reductase
MTQTMTAPPLLRPLKGAHFIEVANRIVMSAMTRGFADEFHRATADIREYYRRRAAGGVGLILTEGVVIHPEGDGYRNVPRIANDDQAASWSPVIEAVHGEGAKIACQLWHCGRISHVDFTDGLTPVSSTDRAAEGINRQNGKPYGKPRRLALADMLHVRRQYTAAATRALAIGFDAVELHLGHGYLVDQFFDARINDRDDIYGGSVENRCRFALELVEDLLRTVPANRLILRMSPSRFMNGLYDWPQLEEMLVHLTSRLWQLGIRVLDISCANADYFTTSGRVIRMIRDQWLGLIIGGASLTPDQAERELQEGWLDLVTWGRAMIANPDLVRKIERSEIWTPFTDAMRGSLQ